MKKLASGQIREFAIALAQALEEKGENISPQSLQALKVEIAQKLGIIAIPKNAAILSSLPQSYKTKKVISILRTRLTRTASGVTPIALMPKPFPCPGQCTYCPQGANAPKSYTGFEPATRRAIQNDYDAFKQINARLCQYAALGQPTDKCELILMGGTFLSVPKSYQNQFVKDCYDAMNGKVSKSLQEAQKANETSAHRVIGLTIETRPDWCSQQHIDEILEWGATRVELGVQTLDEEVLKRVKRGHGVDAVIDTTWRLKDAAFKVGYHFMPGLYSSKESDVRMLRELFENPSFKPDMLKIYPCLVMPGTELYNEWKAGRFEPIGSEEAVERIVEATKFFPPWVRVMRMQRDIPASLIAAGVKNGNLHQMVVRELKKRGQKCRCIRCREVFSPYRLAENGAQEKPKPLNLTLVERSYEASWGMEHFLSFEDVEQDLLAGFIRLRLPKKSHRKEITQSTALIRELHVYGQEVEIGRQEHEGVRVQHLGIGKSLLLRAEEIAQDAGKDKMVIISGVGARPYYARLGYCQEGPYMSKKL